MEKEWGKLDITKFSNKKDTFTELYSLIWKDLYEFAFYTLQNSEEAKDAVHDAIVIAYDKFEDLRSKRAFKFWIFKILSNCCKKRLRYIITNKKSSSLESILEINSNEGEEELMESVYLWNIIKDLKKDERIIVNLSIWAGYKSTEISKMLNMPEGTVRSKLHRALKKLKCKCLDA